MRKNIKKRGKKEKKKKKEEKSKITKTKNIQKPDVVRLIAKST